MEPCVMPPRSSGMTTMGRALRLRCPVCGQGQLFRRFTMLVHCAHCGFHFEREVGYFTNTAVINYAVASLPILFIVAPLAYLRPHAIALEIAIGFLFAIALPLLCFRHVRSLWLAIDVLVRPPVAVEFDMPDTQET
ncbi:MAG: DUF983 domain-containing protein [Chloroflexota bacterium]|nr:DUF983 domain-containing protein [Chloroflexota bacterium]